MSSAVNAMLCWIKAGSLIFSHVLIVQFKIQCGGVQRQNYKEMCHCPKMIDLTVHASVCLCVSSVWVWWWDNHQLDADPKPACHHITSYHMPFSVCWQNVVINSTSLTDLAILGNLFLAIISIICFVSLLLPISSTSVLHYILLSTSFSHP